MATTKVTKAQLEEQVTSLQQELAEMEFNFTEELSKAEKELAKVKKQLATAKKDLKDKDAAVQMDLNNQQAVFKSILADREAEFKKKLEEQAAQFKTELEVATSAANQGTEALQAKYKKMMDEKNAKIRRLQTLIQRLEKPQNTAQAILSKRGLHWNELAGVVDVIKTIREEGKK